MNVVAVALFKRWPARRWVAALVALPLASACAPTSRPLAGVPTPAAMPPVRLAPSPAIWRFTWSYADETFEATGDGVLRILPPDRARLDFFLKNGMSGGFAILQGDSIFVPGPDITRRFLPPPPLLWAALGRLALPATPDTVARQDGDTLRVDLGALRGADASKAQGRAWRLAFGGSVMARVERIEDGRREEFMSRRRGTNGQWELQYANERARRRLSISVTDTNIVNGFDDAIWRRP